MKKINVRDVPAKEWVSPKGRFTSLDQELSVALGRDPLSLDLRSRHPFDVEICRVPAGKASCPYHSHSAQWEFYHVISGTGIVRHEQGKTPIGPDDCFIFGPNEPHQIINDGAAELVVYIVADNPVGESCYYPDSKKWMVLSPKRRLLRSEPLDYFDGEE
ncbi:cupin [Opitutaceae bacterium EW11]|nr:cupin [Opitutaceae bacterium EW11]